jgi:hypothetical protein
MTRRSPATSSGGPAFPSQVTSSTHTFVTELINNGAFLRDAQVALGTS